MKLAGVIVLFSLSFLVDTIVTSEEKGECSSISNQVLKNNGYLDLKFRRTYNATQMGDNPSLNIYCYQGEVESLWKLWTSIKMHIDMNDTSNFKLYQGHTADHVCGAYNSHWTGWLNMWLNMWKARDVLLKPFQNETCVGIYTFNTHKITLIRKAIEPKLVLCLLLGVVLFFAAANLSKNIVFYYGTGVTVGLIGSLLIVVYMVGKRLPKKTTAAAVLLSGWSLVMWFLQYIWLNIQTILEEYKLWVVIYFLMAGLISFAVCYRIGPVTNPKSLDLIKWTIQLFSLVPIYLGSSIDRVSVAFIITVISFNAFPRSVLWWFRNYWRIRFPPKIELLSEEDYLTEADEYTREQLDSLRIHCNSPDCDAWKTISRINSPQRFAEWVQGSASHISNSELLEYDTDPNPSFITDDEDDNISELSFRLGTQ